MLRVNQIIGIFKFASFLFHACRRRAGKLRNFLGHTEGIRVLLGTDLLLLAH